MMDSMENTKLFMIALIVCNVILLVLVLLFSGSKPGVSGNDLTEVHNRLQAIEAKIEAVSFDRDRLEDLERKTGALEAFMNTVQEDQDRLVSRTQDLEQKLASLVEKPPKEPLKKTDREVEKETVEKKPAVDDEADKTRPSPEPLPEGPAAYYTVKEGDTLYSISRQHSLTPEDLRQLNRLDSNTIMPGQRLRIQ